MKKFLVFLLILPFLGGCVATQSFVNREVQPLNSRLSSLETRVSSVEDEISHKVFVGKDRVPPGNIVISGGKIVIYE
ncbi:MAG: hypothetical protein U9P50_02610 [Patescibacteria group bacterium]|nr:hypothetical protein [Patescibacteria group bacterium]